MTSRWTPQEDELLLSNIQNSPENLNSAFKATAKQLGRTDNACSYRWYGTLKSNHANIVSVVSKTKKTNNMKNIKSGDTVSLTPSIGKEVALSILRQLPREKRAEILSKFIV
jgi:hypothetical protein